MYTTMLPTLVLVATFTTPLLASLPFPAPLNGTIARRQSGTCADQGEIDCGSGCIPQGWTCCPDGSGGCSPIEQCELGSNGQYGCCPTGQTCSGAGGTLTSGSGCGSQIACGSGCIDSTWTCCPDGSGGCSPSEQCQLGNNGQYGCCPLGETCNGGGGAEATDGVGGSGAIPTTSTSFNNNYPTPTFDGSAATTSMDSYLSSLAASESSSVASVTATPSGAAGGFGVASAAKPLVGPSKTVVGLLAVALLGGPWFVRWWPALER